MARLAAIVGVEALLSETRSANVVLSSWPIALMMGVSALNIALATLSSLYDHKS